MCRFSEAELYCVNTNMRITSELMQFEIGTSTRRYLPPSGTAGFDRCAVSGNRRLPAPPPRITANRFGLGGIELSREYRESESGYKPDTAADNAFTFPGLCFTL